jgi:hypothetical protein
MVTKRAYGKLKTVERPSHKPLKAAVGPSAARMVRKKAGRKTGRAQKVAVARAEGIDLSAFPSEAVSKLEKLICLACVMDVFTRHMGLALKTAYLEVKRYKPSLAELNNAAVTRPYFTIQSCQDPCPYCGSAPKWHARLVIYRIEGGRATDALRRVLVKALPTSSDRFAALEEKGTCKEAFFQWLEKISKGLDLEGQQWLGEVSRQYLGRKEPKEDWQAQFDQIWSIRRSWRLENGWEVDKGCLFLSPVLFDELLLVQYLVSRSHKAGGLTLEGRYTLPELIARLRKDGYLRAVGITAPNPSDAFEQLLQHLSGGETSMKFHYIVDRSDFLQKMHQLDAMRPPRSKTL